MSSATAGLDTQSGLRRTHRAGEINAQRVGDEVVLGGWVQRRRDHGGVIFVDLRDREGLVQVVFKPDTSSACHEKAGQLRSEYVVLVRGRVQRRSPETINTKLPTGEIEVLADELRILNRATPPPFAIEEEAEADEATRLEHRVHDLRRPPLQRALRLRHDSVRPCARAVRQGSSRSRRRSSQVTPEGARLPGAEPAAARSTPSAVAADLKQR